MGKKRVYSLIMDYISYLYPKLSKMKRIFIIDWWLALAFAITAYSGFELHIAGHFSTHEVWHNWAVCHTLASLTFIILEYYTSNHIGVGIKV